MTECPVVISHKHVWLYIENDRIECKNCGQKSDVQTLKMLQSIQKTVPDNHIPKSFTECKKPIKLIHGRAKIQLPIDIDLEQNTISGLYVGGKLHRVRLIDFDSDNFIYCEFWVELPERTEASIK
jgi:hypothetical protein